MYQFLPYLVAIPFGTRDLHGQCSRRKTAQRIVNWFLTSFTWKLTCHFWLHVTQQRHYVATMKLAGAKKAFPCLPRRRDEEDTSGNTSNISQILHKFFKLPYVSKHHKCIKSHVTTGERLFPKCIIYLKKDYCLVYTEITHFISHRFSYLIRGTNYSDFLLGSVLVSCIFL